MKSILIILKHNFKMYIKTKEIVSMLIFPLVFTMIVGSTLGSKEEKKLDIGFIVKNEDIVTKDLENRILLDYNILKGNKEELEKKVLDKGIEAVIEINSNSIEEEILKGKDLKVKITSLGENETKYILSDKINLAIGEYKSIGRLSQGENFDYILESYINNKVDIKSEILEDNTMKEMSTRNILGAYTIGSLLLAICILAVILKEKKDNTYQRICTSPVKEGSYILGCTLSCYLMLVLQMFLQLGVLKVLGLYEGSSYFGLLIIMLIMGLCTTSIGMIVLVFSPSSEIMGMLGGVIAAPITMLSGMVPYEILPSIIEKISVISPIKWGLDGYVSIINGNPINNNILNLFIILLSACVLLIIAKIKMQISESIN